MNEVKTTSYKYGNEYQNKQVQKYKNRDENHWKYRVKIFNKLLEEQVLPIFSDKDKQDITVVDIGCSIGTFALEAARRGYDATGIDFDKQAIGIAKKLAVEENVGVEFICGDISAEINFNKKIDIAVCFDIFEHLHDDEIGAFLQAIKNRLSEKGVILYHTFPTQFDYIFFENKLLFIPLIPFSILGKIFFEKFVKIYASKIDVILILFKGKNDKELIKTKAHCNPTTKTRLSEVLERAGFQNRFIEVSQLYDFWKIRQKIFKRYVVSYRNLYGVAHPHKK